MGLPPAQGHINLRLTNTAKLYQNHSFRLDTTQFTPHKKTPHNKPHLQPSSIPSLKLQSNSRSLFSSSSSTVAPSSKRRAPTISMPIPIPILKSTHRPRHFRSKNTEQHVQFAPIQKAFSQRNTSYAYPNRKHLPSSSSLSTGNGRCGYSKNVRMNVMSQLNLLPTVTTRTTAAAASRERRSSRRRISSRMNTFVSNMPLINVNSSVVMVNHSPFGLQDPRFGILHHCSQSISYFWIDFELLGSISNEIRQSQCPNQNTYIHTQTHTKHRTQTVTITHHINTNSLTNFKHVFFACYQCLRLFFLYSILII